MDLVLHNILSSSLVQLVVKLVQYYMHVVRCSSGPGEVVVSTVLVVDGMVKHMQMTQRRALCWAAAIA